MVWILLISGLNDHQGFRNLVSKVVNFLVKDKSKIVYWFEEKMCKNHGTNKYWYLNHGQFYYKPDIYFEGLFDDLKLYDFETFKAKGVNKYDDYLSKIYGEYMIVPDEYKRFSLYN